MANRVLIGKDTGNNYALKVSKSGQNVLSTDPGVLTFNSQINDSTSGITSAGGRSFNVLQSGSISPSGGTDANSESSYVYFPSIVDNSGNYTIPFVHALYEKEETDIGADAGYYWGYSNASDGYSFGAYFQIYSHGFNSTGGNHSSGTQYGRIEFTYRTGSKLSISYYILATPVHE